MSRWKILWGVVSHPRGPSTNFRWELREASLLIEFPEVVKMVWPWRKTMAKTWSKSIWKWWFQTSFAFSIVYGIIPSHGLICFKMVKTTNQVKNCKNPRNGATGATPMVAGVGSCHTAMQRAFGSWTKLLGSNCSVLGDPKEGSHMKSQLRFVEYELQWVYCKLYYFHCSLPRAASVDKILSFWVWDSPECCPEVVHPPSWWTRSGFFLLRWRVSTWIFWGMMKTIENLLGHIHETTWITMVLCFFWWGWLVNIHESLLVQGICQEQQRSNLDALVRREQHLAEQCSPKKVDSLPWPHVPVEASGRCSISHKNGKLNGVTDMLYDVILCYMLY